MSATAALTKLDELRTNTDKLATLIAGAMPDRHAFVKPVAGPVPVQIQSEILRPGMSVERYCGQLDVLTRRLEGEAMADALADLTAVDLEGLAHIRAQMRARYFKQLILATRRGRRPLDHATVVELQRLREGCSEIEAALQALQSAVTRGSVPVAGTAD
ncbi:MAG: hypothetical protein HY246_26665 [Proteobacteria bacterium]|nr:hypothetical protein [Pseudomonadota bacterium]